MKNLDRRQKLTTPQIARLWGISVGKVTTWIRNGELPAINAATKQGGRPRYLVDRKDLDDFEQRRAVLSPMPRATRSPKPDDLIEFV